ncbi:MAG: class I SAM-dependent methyltransferase [Bacteroidales bacterium]|jgi:ubiquinone/menaquinone biosynthesis C-methylase UbiE|nr:class I SAM-dependent methyltransferase [Bacteroidales bacterium]
MGLILKIRQFHVRQLFLPNLFSVLVNPFFLCRVGMAKQIARFAKQFPQNGRMLDFGCGHKPYRSFFPNVSEYIGVDFENEGHSHSKEKIDVSYDGKTLPFPDAYFDCAICTEVLEHVPDIDGTLDLLNHACKDKALIIFTVPFIG